MTAHGDDAPPRRDPGVTAGAFGGPGPIRAQLLHGPCRSAQIQARAEPDGRPPSGITVFRTDIPPLEYDPAALIPPDDDTTLADCLAAIPLPQYEEYRLVRDQHGNPVPHGTTWLYVWMGHRGPIAFPEAP